MHRKKAHEARHMEIPRPPSEERDINEVHIEDIKAEDENIGLKNIIAAKRASYKEFKGINRSSLPKNIFWGIIGLILFFLVGSAVLFFSLREKASGVVSSNFGSIEAGAQDLQNFDLQGAAREFSASHKDISADLEKIGGVFSFLFQGGGPLSSFVDISKQLSSISDELNGLQTSFFDFLSTGNGETFISELTRVHDTLHIISSESDGISGMFSFLGKNVPTSIDLLSLRTEMKSASDFLDVFVPWLSSSTPHHVLVLFQNPSEIRPTGGFLGSYADVQLEAGNITSISVHDIADVDVGFMPNIIPPKPLQAEVSRFRPADANWFFDFSDSASKTISLFEQSNLYAASSTKFDMAIAVSPKVISDILSLTGSITVSSTKSLQGYGGQAKAVFDSDTFLIQIQKIVQDGQATGATYPKGVLKDLMANIFKKMETLDDSQKQTILPMAIKWMDGKDVMLYAKDPEFESFFNKHLAAGTVAELPQNFEGDYCAIVDTNIVGQKSDLYISQNITIESQINIDGTVNNNIMIVRKHNGNTSPYWWYSAPNQDYLQIFTPQGSVFSNESGGIAKKIIAPIAYAKKGYLVDQMISTIESTQKDIFGYPVSTHEESGKTVFSMWARVTAGNSTTISFDYSHRLFLAPADGIVYQFIFDKQAGVTRHYKFEIMAPVGFQFAENNLPTYSYEADDIPGRLVLNLTLKKIQ